MTLPVARIRGCRFPAQPYARNYARSSRKSLGNGLMPCVQQEILRRLVAVHPIEVPEVLLNEELRRAYLQHKRQETDGQLTEADYHVAPESLQ